VSTALHVQKFPCGSFAIFDEEGNLFVDCMDVGMAEHVDRRMVNCWNIASGIHDDQLQAIADGAAKVAAA
jgi:hypothetical protein